MEKTVQVENHGIDNLVNIRIRLFLFNMSERYIVILLICMME